jgi:hypothetical protein
MNQRPAFFFSCGVQLSTGADSEALCRLNKAPQPILTGRKVTSNIFNAARACLIRNAV